MDAVFVMNRMYSFKLAFFVKKVFLTFSTFTNDHTPCATTVVGRFVAWFVATVHSEHTSVCYNSVCYVCGNVNVRRPFNNSSKK